MSKILSVVLACIVIVLTLNVQLSAAQGAVTPTPAPSKTPTAAVTLSAEVTEEAGTSQAFEPLTQADLSILTGNVQRPNGIAWFNDKLYTACTGDSTVYEIDSRTGVTRTYIFGVRNAQTMYVEEDENQALTIWVPDYANNTLARVTRNGAEPHHQPAE